MEAKANVVNNKKSFKEKFHDYMMGMSRNCTIWLE